MGSDGPAPGRTRLPGRWFRLRFVAPRAQEDDVVGLLQLAGSEGLTSQPGGPRRLAFEAWFASREHADEALRLLAAILGLNLGDAAPEPVEDPGWLDAALTKRGALEAGRFIVFDDDVPRGAGDVPAGRLAILLPAGRAFGTGEHATTRMCLELLDALLAPGERVLDMGTGSAILAIAAAKAGARSVLALDNDPLVIDVAVENLALNGVADRIEVGSGSWPQLPPGRTFDLLLANIHRTALVRGAAALSLCLAPGGRAILSGFHGDDAGLVRAAWERAGMVEVAAPVSGEWAALAFRKP